MALPTVTMTAAESAFIQKVIGVYTPPGESPTPVNFVSDLVDYEGENEIIKTKFPGADLKLRNIRIDQVSSEEAFSLKLLDLKKVTDILGGLNGFKQGGTVKLFLLDPKDATGKVRIQTDAFLCSVERTGGVKFGGKEASSATLKFTSLKDSDVVLTFNGDVPA
jgi:hypothetical protein